MRKGTWLMTMEVTDEKGGGEQKVGLPKGLRKELNHNEYSGASLKSAP